MSPASQNHTLAALAVSYPSASRVFRRHQLDFCCKGNRSLESACLDQELDPNNILSEILESDDPPKNWNDESLEAIISYVIVRYHRPAVQELSDLLAMAQRVEKRHSDKAECPRGLFSVLNRWTDELLSHMHKEELILFPLFASGQGKNAVVPVQVMEAEHSTHGETLTEVRRLTNNYSPPENACTTWRALYLRLETFERELMEHIALEQEVLFPRGLERMT